LYTLTSAHILQGGVFSWKKEYSAQQRWYSCETYSRMDYKASKGHNLQRRHNCDRDVQPIAGWTTKQVRDIIFKEPIAAQRTQVLGTCKVLICVTKTDIVGLT
jgi:hypothetical protein